MSEMMSCDLKFKVPLSWEGPVEVRRHISGWGGPSGHQPVYGGVEYIQRTVRLPAFEWISDESGYGFDVDQPLGWEALEIRWQGELNYGWYDSDGEALLGWLRTNRVPFVACCDGKYEFDGDTEVFDGTESVSATSGNSGAFMTECDWQSLVAEAAATDSHADVNRWLVGAVDEWFKRRSGALADMDISHLPPDPPTDEEGE